MAHILRGKISLIINGGMSQTITFIIEYPINYSGGKSIIHISFKLGRGRSVATWQSCSQPLWVQQQFCCNREEMDWEQVPCPKLYSPDHMDIHPYTFGGQGQFQRTVRAWSSLQGLLSHDYCYLFNVIQRILQASTNGSSEAHGSQACAVGAETEKTQMYLVLCERKKKALMQIAGGNVLQNTRLLSILQNLISS